MRIVSQLVFIAALAVGLSSCAPKNHPVPGIGYMHAPRGTVTHIVIMSLYDRGDVTARDEIIAAADQLRRIPGIIAINAGRMLASDRAVVDKSFDVAYVVTLHDEGALQRYLVNPIHVTTKKNILDRYVRRYMVYDIVAE